MGLTAAAKAAAASGGINLPLPWPQNMRPKEAMPISPPLTPLPATMRNISHFKNLFKIPVAKKNKIHPYNRAVARFENPGGDNVPPPPCEGLYNRYIYVCLLILKKC